MNRTHKTFELLLAAHGDVVLAVDLSCPQVAFPADLLDLGDPDDETIFFGVGANETFTRTETALYYSIPLLIEKGMFECCIPWESVLVVFPGKYIDRLTVEGVHQMNAVTNRLLVAKKERQRRQHLTVYNGDKE